MALTPSNICQFGWQAPEFDLPATDGKRYKLNELSGPKGLVLVFGCNHCPYVQAILERLIFESAELDKLDIKLAMINANDADQYPDDSFPKMVQLAATKGFNFPYLHDADQSVARAYGAVCTPDFFGFNAQLQLQYRGRLDDAGRQAQPAASRELYEAMRQVAASGRGPEQQVASIGCSIKWK